MLNAECVHRPRPADISQKPDTVDDDDDAEPHNSHDLQIRDTRVCTRLGYTTTYYYIYYTPSEATIRTTTGSKGEKKAAESLSDSRNYFSATNVYEICVAERER